jgi:type IV pilus assembly protein PilV
MSLSTLPALQRGFNLIEVLVAMVIIAFGLLGIAGIQALSLNNAAVARTRSLAAIEADGLASLMHANTSYWQSPSVPADVNGFTMTGSHGGSYSDTVISDSGLNGQSTDCAAATCSGVQMAGYDLKRWGLSMANLLPSGTGKIECAVVSNTPVSCRLTLYWQETNLALNKVTGTETGNLASGTSVTQSYSVVVQP